MLTAPLNQFHTTVAAPSAATTRRGWMASAVESDRSTPGPQAAPGARIAAWTRDGAPSGSADQVATTRPLPLVATWVLDTDSRVWDRFTGADQSPPGAVRVLDCAM